MDKWGIAAMDIHGWWDTAVPIIATVGIRIVGAGFLYIIGRWLIGLAVSLASRVLTARSFDATLQRYVVNILAGVLNVVLVVAILGYFGVETTSFAALLAGAGLAIGAAWSGLLANFAAGAFLIVFRPYRVGDYVLAGGVEGTVEEIGLFNTILLTPDSVTTIVGNAKVSGDTIKNFRYSFLSPGRPHGPVGLRRRSARRNRAAEVSPGSNSQRGRRSSARCGNSGLQHIGDLVGCAPLLP